jgi:hypothetical protein
LAVFAISRLREFSGFIKRFGDNGEFSVLIHRSFAVVYYEPISNEGMILLYFK